MEITGDIVTVNAGSVVASEAIAEGEAGTIRVVPGVGAVLVDGLEALGAEPIRVLEVCAAAEDGQMAGASIDVALPEGAVIALYHAAGLVVEKLPCSGGVIVVSGHGGLLYAVAVGVVGVRGGVASIHLDHSVLCIISVIVDA